MITRGRHCLGNGKFSAFVDSIVITVPANEPLHFLYPRWHRHHYQQVSVRQSHSSALWPESSNSLDVHKSHDRFSRYKSKQPPRLLSTQAGGHPDAPLAAGNSCAAAEQFRHGAVIGSSESSPRTLAKDSSQDAPDNRPKRPFRQPELTQTQKKITVAKRVRDAEQKRLRHRPYKERIKVAYRKHVHNYRRLGARPTSAPHWTEIMALLEEMYAEISQESDQINRKEIYVREETVAHLCGMPMSDENIWDVTARNGCRIHVMDLSESEGIYRKVVISGSTRALELVEKRIRQIELVQEGRKHNPKRLLGIDRPPMPIIPSVLALYEKGAPVPYIRCVWDDADSVELEPVAELDPAWRVQLYSVPGFTWYVDQLIRRKPSKERIDVERALVTLFKRSELKPYLSTGALNLALEYLCSQEHLSSARLVFNQGQSVATAESYNIFLRSTARRQDLVFLKTLLERMKTHGIRPNGETWVAFLQCLISPSPRHQVMVRMRELDLLRDPRVLFAVVEYNIDIMLTAHFRDGGDIASFLAFLEDRYDKNIVSVRLLNLILMELAPLGEGSRVREVFDAFNRYRLTPSNTTIDVAFLFFRSLYTAMPALWEFLQKYEFYLSSSNYEKLFRLAIRSKSYNACRVIWTYACMRDKTSPLMRHIVRLSLKNHAVDLPSHTKKLNSKLGALLVGLRYRDQDVVHSKHIQDIVPPSHADTPVLYATTQMPAASVDRIRLVKRLVLDDNLYGKTREPVDGLFLMLDAAIRLDRETPWLRTGQDDMHARPLTEILDLMMAIPSRERLRTGKEGNEDGA